MAAIKKAIEKDGLKFLLNWLISEIEQKTQLNISTDISETSTNQQIAGAQAVYDLVDSALAGLVTLEMTVVETLPAEGEPLTFYLIKISNDPETYSQNVWINDQWRTLGSTEMDLSGYWAKDELDFLTNTEIQEIIDEVMGV
jgi:hypothetical protein